MVPPLALQEQMAAFIEQTDKSKVVVQDEVNGL
jgi:type I restriction enzyme S subunit